MKKLLTIAAATVACSAMAAFSPSISVTQITTSLKNTILPVNVTSLESGNVKASDLVCTDGLDDGTQLYVFSGSGYKGFVLSGGAWTAVESTSTLAPGVTVEADSSVRVASGSAVWLIFAETPSSQTVYVYGKLVSSPTCTVTANATNLICNPTGSAATPGTTSMKFATGDKIVPIAAENAGEYVYNGSAWKYRSATGVISDGTVALPSIPKYGGFWYISKGGYGTISW